MVFVLPDKEGWFLNMLCGLIFNYKYLMWNWKISTVVQKEEGDKILIAKLNYLLLQAYSSIYTNHGPERFL